jgi:hypothetical protein
VKQAAERTAIDTNTTMMSRSSSRTGLDPPNEKMITTDLLPKSIRSPLGQPGAPSRRGTNDCRID